MPLSLDGSPQPSSKHSSRTHDSIALHDAAVQSATSLMAVMNDMLRSPPLSAHLFVQNNHPDALNSMNGRPRSRTAPPTPLVEASAPLPVELPGSFPLGIKSHNPLHHSVDGKGLGYAALRYPANAAIGASILRPHSSPQEATHNIPDDPNASTPQILLKSHLQPPSKLSPRSRSASTHQTTGELLSNSLNGNTLVGHGKSN